MSNSYNITSVGTIKLLGQIPLWSLDCAGPQERPVRGTDFDVFFQL